MTLSTYIYVHDRVPRKELFEFCQGALTDYDKDKRRPDQQEKEDGEGWREDGSRLLANKCGQGLPAWLMLGYRADGPVRPEPEAHSDDCGQDCTGPHEPAHWLWVNLDTAYGYKSAQGFGCSTLHAILIAVIGHWLDARGAAWSWCNEYTGEIHRGIAGLDGLIGSGKQAMEWFNGTVKPALARLGVTP